MSLGFDVDNDWAYFDGDHKQERKSGGEYKDPKELTRPGEGFEFYVEYGGSREIQVIDNPELNSNPVVGDALARLGFPQGPFQIKEHSVLTNEKKWRRYPCANRNWKDGMDAVKRLYFTKVCGSWQTISEEVEKDPTLVDKIFKNTYMDDVLLTGMLSQARYEALKEVIATPLGGRLECPVCEADSKNWPSLTFYMTCVMLGDFETKGGDSYQNPIRTLRLNKESVGDYANIHASTLQEKVDVRGSLRPNTNYGPGLDKFVFKTSRGSEQTSPKSGGAPVVQYKLEDTGENNPNAKYPLTVESIQKRLDDDNGFYKMRWLLETGQAPNAEKICKTLKDAGLEYIPWTNDYTLNRLPKTKNYLLNGELKGVNLAKEDKAKQQNKPAPVTFGRASDPTVVVDMSDIPF